MLKNRSKEKDLKHLINQYIIVYVNNLPITSFDETTGTAILAGLEGYAAQVTENYIYLARTVDSNPDLMINVDQVLVITTVDPEQVDGDNKDNAALKVLDFNGKKDNGPKTD